MNYKLVSYAMDFASFLVQKTKNTANINNIILFGSVARGDEEKTSDIDLFIEVIHEGAGIEKEIKECLDSFLCSAKYKNYWKLLGIVNEIRLVIGRLDKWPELKASIIANGLLLYGKFMPEIKEGRHLVFFIWENVKPNSRRVLLNKKIFGYVQKKKIYKGLLQQVNGEKLGKGCVVVPLEHSSFFLKVFREYKVDVKIRKVLDYF